MPKKGKRQGKGREASAASPSGRRAAGEPLHREEALALVAKQMRRDFAAEAQQMEARIQEDKERMGPGWQRAYVDGELDADPAVRCSAGWGRPTSVLLVSRWKPNLSNAGVVSTVLVTLLTAAQCSASFHMDAATGPTCPILACMPTPPHPSASAAPLRQLLYWITVRGHKADEWFVTFEEFEVRCCLC